MKQLYFLFTFLACAQILSGQNLKPSIGITALPSDAATVCAIPTYTGSFAASGYQAGDTIPHFQLYDKNGAATDVLVLLQTGKPLLLIDGSYTCPVFRQKINKINQVAATYSGQINVLVVYVVEAHPNTPDPSPYSGSVWVTSENQSESILYLQPTTYGGRKQVLNDMLANPLYTLSVPVLIDGPCNEWWLNFGPAPNNAYLIKPNGVIYKKHGWFDKNPDNIVNDINALLSAPTGIKEVNRNALAVYPNPASEFINFDLGSNQAEISIHDATGKKIMTEEMNGNVHRLNIKNFEPGLYIYTIRGLDFIRNGKFIKE